MSFVKFGDFEYSLALSAAAVALMVLSDTQGRISPLFAVALFALCQAGFFALQALKKGGVSSPDAEYLFIVVVIVAFLASSLSFLALSAVLPLIFVPVALSLPSVAALARGFISSG